MLPTILARQMQIGMRDYLESNYSITNPLFQGVISRLVQGNTLFHEPYVAIRLPFRGAERDTNYFEAVEMPFRPFVHQQRAFERLLGKKTQSTLVATGTGSGKTECFLFPILEHCYQNRGTKGIKALIIYPMNALATDQATRLAKLIYTTAKLKGNVSAGMYVGGKEEHPSLSMGKERIITDKETILREPPDILLTNYKMLDYLLVRPKDARLWEKNEPDTLKYIVVDELHTFDGAQGTDLACLLRRLKDRLGTKEHYLCCVGTSATMGTEDGSTSMIRYAEKIFGEPFEGNAVITEDRLQPQEFFASCPVTDETLPTSKQSEELAHGAYEWEPIDYLTFAASAWFALPPSKEELQSLRGRSHLRQQLLEHGFVQALLKEMKTDFVRPSYLIEKMQRRFIGLRKLSEPEAALDALIALISHARVVGANQEPRPFLHVQVQVWFRELRRLLGRVSAKEPDFVTDADLCDESKEEYLPVVNCSDCGETGWVGLLDERQRIHARNLDAFYNLFFRQDEKIRMIFPCKEEEGRTTRLCTKCRIVSLISFGEGLCRECGGTTLAINMPSLQVVGKKDNRRYLCPSCGGSGLILIGLRATTLTSALTSLLYASSYNDDKKLLAFCDNVQDAAHRAGFFNARTWRFVLRSALARYLKEEGGDRTLEEFAKGFGPYYEDKLPLGQFVTWFCAPNLTWRKTYEAIKGEGRWSKVEEKALLEDIKKRLEYETYLEFGLFSKWGHTLLRSGVGVLGLDPRGIPTLFSRLQERLVNEVGLSHTVSLAIPMLVLGWIQELKRQGAFSLDVYYGYRRHKGSEYQISNDHQSFLPGLRIGYNTPQFLVQEPGKYTDFQGGSFYERWIEKVFACTMELTLGLQAKNHEVAGILVEELRGANILEELKTNQGVSTFGLNPRSLILRDEGLRYRCNSCGFSVVTAKTEDAFWEEMVCLRRDCRGVFTRYGATSLDFHGRLYQKGDLVRIFAEEHTGLLERTRREGVEKSFKNKEDRKPWDINLLSCTPTLEMGIDIGDLSTVILCNVPRHQAQYLQRLGRAGRTDGNVLTLTIANSKPHDLYFYADPMEMIAGSVKPPDLFLNAGAVLARQFVAFCFDRFVKSGVGVDSIPKNMSVCLAKEKKPGPFVFPHTLLNFIKQGVDTLLLDFYALFGGELKEDTKKELAYFAKGEGTSKPPLTLKLLGAISSLYAEREALRSTVRALNKAIKELKEKPKDSAYDEEIKELETEKRALGFVIRGIDEKDVFNFLSDEGLLPNYAFPEAGITLKALLRRKGEEEGTDRYDRFVYEYQRPSSAAMSEFAPNNAFYAEGRKVIIDEVDMGTSEVTKWRLCPNCSYAQMEGLHTPRASCPNCGSRLWADTGQVRSMLRLRMVYAHSDYGKSMIDDGSEERARTFYCRDLLVDVNEEEDIIKAYSVTQEKIAFGYEFVKKAVIRDINFGEAELVGEHISVAGKNAVRKGFRVCSSCGRVQGYKKEMSHAKICPVRRQGALLQAQECLFLYREFATEALRILIPATSLDVRSEQQESFVATFMLGMEKHFGNVDHLRYTISDVPILDTPYRKQYLVVYDSVPGGTGYLKELMTSKEMLLDIFQGAFEVLNSCECLATKRRDGCYRCLFAYGQSNKMTQITKSVAIKQCQQILKARGQMDEVRGLRDISVDALLESELERQFIAALERLAKKQGAQLTAQLVNHNEGFLLQKGDVLWEIEPQVVLDRRFGVGVMSRADFVIWPRGKHRGKRPVVVFTDGFAFHKSIVAKDVEKRLALCQSEGFRVWVLSWQDVESVLEEQTLEPCTALDYSLNPTEQLVSAVLSHLERQDLQAATKNPLELLLLYLLESESEERFIANAKAQALSLVDFQEEPGSLLYASWSRLMEPIAPLYGWESPSSRFAFRVGHRRITGLGGGLHLLAAVREGSLDPLRMKVVVVALLEDQDVVDEESFQKEWQSFWRFFNLLQFTASFAVAARSQLTGDPSQVLIPLWQEEASVAATLDSSLWIEVMPQIFDEKAKALARELEAKGIIPPSEVGYCVLDDKGRVILEAELAWEEKRIVFLCEDQARHKEGFLARGWRILASAMDSSLF